MQIKERTIRGKTYYTAYLGRVDGKPKIITRADRNEVEEAITKYQARREKVGKAALRLNEQDLRDAATAAGLLDGRVTLAGAARFWLKHNTAEQTVTVQELIERYVERAKKEDCTERTIRDIRSRLKPFGADYGEALVSHVTRADIAEWLTARPGGKANEASYRRHLSGLLNYACDQGIVDENRAAKKRRRRTNKSGTKQQQARKPILTTTQARTLMRTAEAMYPQMVPHLTLLLFCGLRPECEAQHISWDAVDLEGGHLFVSGAISKTGHERYVELKPNAVEWLLPHAKDAGLVFYSRRMMRAIREKAGVPWATDITRHTFASYHLAAFRNGGDTAEQLGHRGGLDVLFQHYRKPTTKPTGETYWRIRPSTSKGKVIRMKSA